MDGSDEGGVIAQPDSYAECGHRAKRVTARQWRLGCLSTAELHGGPSTALRFRKKPLKTLFWVFNLNFNNHR